MRSRGPRRKAIPARSWTGEPTIERERLERHWYHLMERDDRLGKLVTGEALADEPFHRWLPFKQAFAPELVRTFLSETMKQQVGRNRLPLLDPFAGSGTFVIECAHRGVNAQGVEALSSLAFVASARGAREFPDLPDLTGSETWEQAAARLECPIHRAALICAVARRHTSAGTLNKNAAPLLDELGRVTEMMREDLRSPLSVPVRVEQGDARRLDSIEDGSIGGILTSPPYLSRHDYTRTARPHEMVHRYWHEAPDMGERRRAQVRAHPKAHKQRWTQQLPPAAAEACQALSAAGEKKLAGVVRSYFEDVFTALGECARVLADGAPCWIVVGGARLKDVYIPTDAILADFAGTCGFEVDRVRVARRLLPGGRKMGSLTNVAPRESILVMRQAGRGD
ncbi:MAG TPA: hypothetical protein VM243_17395 [Phycisphaerae bacterium]|nr:hypothetical protein [Phycisphaerae bacterium]